MVTQDAAVIPQVPKVKMKKVKKKSKKKVKVANNVDSESEADKLDLDQKMYTLSHYISDQEELVNQMFLTISGSKLEAMLPPVLKSTPLTELKRLCLHELRGMSKKRILCCINGEVMEGSSGSEDEEDDKEEAAADNLKQNDANTTGEKRKPGDDQNPESYLMKKIKVEPGLEDSTGSGEGKSVLELLELEMRARIIKTMLEKGDEGKKITEDAIAAVMQSAKQITKEGGDATGGVSKDAANVGVETKDDSQEKDLDREALAEEETMERRSRGRRKSQSKEDRRRRRHPAGDGKRNSSRSQRRGDGSYSDEGSCGRSSRKQKDPSSSDKHVIKKKKITRKEFEERMKRAKKNRTYRQRKSSEDEEKTKEDENKPEENPKEDNEEKTEDKTDAKPQDAPSEGNVSKNMAEGEASEKEEGEIDSNEEEEGACSPTDVSSASRYSSSSSYSRSHSRSYSRSLSRSPYRGRQRRSRRSRSRSRSKKRRRSYSRSYSRSRSPERRKGRVEYPRRSYERKRSREPLRSSSKRDIKKSSPAEDTSPSREEDWGHKCDIEFVDSEEDFDDNPEVTNKDAGGQKAVPVNRIERASISFSLQKKPVGIAQSVDLDDLPLKKKQVADDVQAISSVKPPTSEEIVISSDSEAEGQGSSQGTTRKQKSSKESKPESKEQTDKVPVPSITNSRSDGTIHSDTASNKGHIESIANHAKIVKKAGDTETKTETVARSMQEETSEDSSKLATDTIREIHTEKGVNNVDKGDSKEESPTGDSKVSSINMDGSESTWVDTGDACENVERENSDNSPDNKHDSKSESSGTETAALSDRSEANSKEKGSESLCEKEDQDDNVPKYHISRVGVKTNENSLDETEMMKSSSKKSPRRKTEKGADLKHNTSIPLLEEGGQTATEVTISSESKSQPCKSLEMESKDEDTCVDSENEEKVEKSGTSLSSEQKEEVDKKEATAVCLDKSEEDFYEGKRQVIFNKDEKESEGRIFRELHKRRTHVEPIRLETGLIRRRVQPSRKIEMIVPEKSWMKRGKKKNERTKDVLAKEGIGLLKNMLVEAAQTSSQDSELETEASQSMKLVEASENKEVSLKPVMSPAQVSDTENSQPLQDLGAQKVASPSPKRDTSPEASQSEDKSLRKIEHDTEIIGVIETSKGPSDNFEDMDLGGSSWSMRWLQSEKVQRVVTSSKMLSRVRKKIQKKEKATKVVMAEKVEEAQKPSDPVVPVIGSIEEYERLFGTKVKKDEAASAVGSVPQDSSVQGQTPGSSVQTHGDIPEAKDKGNPVFGSDDDGEDSEEEALWSKIIKK